jgi:hypothetical protein
MKIRFLILVLALAPCAFSQQGFSVVANKDNPAKSISKTLLRRMMMGEAPTWPNGAKVVVLLGPAGDSARGAALKQICDMGEGDFAKYLLKLSFEGGTKAAPKTLPSATSIRLVLQLTPGGLGIVESAQSAPGFKLLPIE